MMRCIIVTLFLCAFVVQHNSALNADDYVAYVEQLSQDEVFLEEYAQWSFELFSQPDYIYGDKHRVFPCPAAKDKTVPTSVHQLRPSDIKCVGAMGDSLTAALGAHAITPIGLLFENRGVSWSVGGDNTYSKVLSVPNALRQYNPDLEGYSTKASVIFLKGQNATNNGLNVAKSGAVSKDMSDQADILLSRLNDTKLCDWHNDWKLITLFIGGNDLCSFCQDPDLKNYTPEQYLANVRDALDKLYAANLPRTFVNLVLVLDVRNVEELNSGGFICRTMHKRTCPCAAFPTPEQRTLLSQYVPRYQEVLKGLADSDRYDNRPDFTVVYQPFMVNTHVPRKPNHKIDFSYFAPDCFHFSGKGHAQAALSLWNNMLEPVGAKQTAWHINETLSCPSDQFPYIFTKNNSAKALAEFQRNTIPVGASTTHRQPSATTSTKPAKSTSHHHKKHKHEKSDSQWTIMSFAVVVGVFLLLLIILTLAVSKRQKIRVFLHGAGRRHLNGFTDPNYPDESDDIEIWNRSTSKSTSSINHSIPKTHGTRVLLE